MPEEMTQRSIYHHNRPVCENIVKVKQSLSQGTLDPCTNLTRNVYSIKCTPRIKFKDAHTIFRTRERMPGAVTGSNLTFCPV